MTRVRAFAMLVLLASITAFGWTAEAKTKQAPTTDTGRLIAAASSCDLTKMKSLIDAGTDVNAIDATGFDVLSRASQDVYPLARTRFGLKKQYRLKCPDAVTMLTKAGANPRKAKVYHNPKIDEDQPSLTAIVSVQDARETKGGGLAVDEKLAKAVEDDLRYGHYPIIRLEEVRQKLRTAGLSEDETLNPDRMKACKVLGADAVVDATLKDFRKKDIGIQVASGSSIEINITDCGTGELLYRSDIGNINESRGFIARAFVSEFDMAVQAAIIIPVYEREK